VLASLALQEFEAFDSDAQAKKNVVRAIEAVAGKLGNTPSVCRKCYVHPAVIESYLDGTLATALRRRADRAWAEELRDLRPEEAAVLALLRRRLAREEDRAEGRDPGACKASRRGLRSAVEDDRGDREARRWPTARKSSSRRSRPSRSG
jgi:hypothetical protein